MSEDTRIAAYAAGKLDELLRITETVPCSDEEFKMRILVNLHELVNKLRELRKKARLND